VANFDCDEARQFAADCMYSAYGDESETRTFSFMMLQDQEAMHFLALKLRVHAERKANAR
jgi:hypothetical protein